MKIRPNRKYTTIAIYATIVIAVNLLLIISVLKFKTIAKLFGLILGALSPVIWGLVIAFLMNPLMVGFEKVINKRIIKKKEGYYDKVIDSMHLTKAKLDILIVVLLVIVVLIFIFGSKNQ